MMLKVLYVISWLVIFLMGLIMVFNISSAEILDHDVEKNYYYPLLWHLFCACLGLVVALFLYYLGCQRFFRLAPFLYGCLIFALVLVLIPGIGREVNGSRRWFRFIFFTVQPSELAKIVLPLFVIYRKMQVKEWKLFAHFLKDLSFIALPVGLIWLEPDNGSVFMLSIIVAAVLFLMNIPLRYWVLVIMAASLVGGVSLVRFPYVLNRCYAYWYPDKDIKGKGHQAYQAKIAAGSGGLWGRGPGNSYQKMSYLPEAQNDYIAAVFAEEYGYIGIICLIFLYFLICYLGFYFAYRTENEVNYLLISIVTFVLIIQAILNLGVVSGLLPSTGLNLPLFSQGGTSLVVNICSIALILSAYSEVKEEMV